MQGSTKITISLVIAKQMYKFTVERIEEVVGRIKFYKLYVDDICFYDQFCEQIIKDSNLKKQLITIISRMDDIANMRRLDHTKFKDITLGKDKVKEFEIKTNDLRVYLIKEEFTGNIILIAGKKSSQQKDINRFRSIKEAYLKSKKE